MKHVFLSITAPLALLATAGQAHAADGDLLDTTCGQYLQAIEIAKPGQNANADRNAQAVAAQDDIIVAMMWVHGYLSGRGGSTSAAGALTREWMIAHVGKLAAVCRTDGSTTRLADAAKKL